MLGISLDPSRNVPIYIRKNTANSITFRFDQDVSDETFELKVYAKEGSDTVVITPEQEAIVSPGTEVTFNFTEEESNIRAKVYFWKLNLTNRNITWLNGPFIVHDGQFDDETQDVDFTINDGENVIEVTITTSGVSQDDLDAAIEQAVEESRETRVYSVASTATLTVNVDDYDQANVTAQAEALTIANPTGTPSDGQGLLIRLEDNGTSRAITFGAQFRAFGSALPTATTLGKIMYIGAFWNALDSKWDTRYTEEV